MNTMSIKLTFIALFSLLLNSAGYSQTTLDGSFLHDGILRNYRIYIPAVYNPYIPVPLLFNLHGYGSNNLEQEAYGNFRPIADTADFIIVHPNGTFDYSNNRFWNTFGNSTVDDVGFISALIDTISKEYNIDQNRIYSTGMSNGGFMSYELACRLSGRIAAIASVTGGMTYAQRNACNATHPTPVMEIHGTADGTVPYAGNLVFIPVDTLVNYWVRFNNCSLLPTVTQVPDINTFDGCTAELRIFNGGNQGSSVELYRILGGGHTWPGAPVIIGVTNMDFSASAAIWRFFSRYDLNGLITGINDDIPKLQPFTVYPNPGTGIFMLNFTDASERKITVTNYLGQIVQSLSNMGEKAVLNVEAGGMYFISVKIGNQTFTKKIICFK